MDFVTLPETITNWIKEHFQSTNCFMVDIKIWANNSKIQVLIDCDEGVDIDTCAKLSRYLEQQLEKHKLVPEKYLLEVSSPGVGTPLKFYRQYQKSINRQLTILLADNSTLEGTLTEVREDGITIIPLQPKTQKGKASARKTGNENQPIQLLFEQIKEAAEKIVF
ncbi:MAG TPA: ribosome maturation factor [Chitinophagales bacterium]|nr:ribosome maturation factor [Chitinophagales bacterium]HRK27575.1 ribosome maturation factor [Chitinophagales bacterium]